MPLDVTNEIRHWTQTQYFVCVYPYLAYGTQYEKRRKIKLLQKHRRHYENGFHYETVNQGKCKKRDTERGGGGVESEKAHPKTALAI